MTDKKIAFIIGSLDRGGAERVISILSQKYAESGWQTDIILLLENKIEYRISPNTRILDFSGNTTSRWRRLPFWLRKIRNYVKRENPDVIVSFVARINVITQIAILGLHTGRVILSERNDPRCDGRGRIVRLLTERLYPKADHIVFQTKRASDYFPHLTNSIIISNPIRIEEPASPLPEPKIVTVGRLTKQKNQKLLIDAFAAIANDFPEYTLEIYGEGDLRNYLQEIIDCQNLQDRVSLKGNVFHIHKAISRAALFILPSDYEGLSNALLEAMMMGLPCISTACAGSDEYITSGENGILIPVGDKNALVDAVKLLLSDSELRKRLGHAAAASSARFNAETVIGEWQSIIE